MIELRAFLKLSMLEFLRDRVVWIGVFVAILLFAISILLGSLSFSEQQRILAHVGWSAIQISTLFMSLLLSANWLQKEMDRQTCLIVLARPISREVFLVGKFLPIVLLTLLLQLLLSFMLFCLLSFSFPVGNYLVVLYGTALEVLVVLGIAFSMATFMRPMLAFIASFSVFLIGHWTQEIEFFGSKTKSATYTILAKIAKWLFPNLYQYNWRTVYFLENGVGSSQIIWVSFHALAWILFVISIATLVFRRKDLV